MLPETNNHLSQQEEGKIDALKKSIPALAVAITGQTDIDIVFATGQTRSVGNKLYVSELISLLPQDLTLWRGMIDRALFKIVYYDQKIENTYRPLDPRAAQLYVQLIRLGYELLGIQSFKGIRRNIQSLYYNQEFDPLSDMDRGLYYVVKFLCPCLLPDIQSLNAIDKTLFIPYLNQLTQQLTPATLAKYAKTAHDYAIFVCRSPLEESTNEDYPYDTSLTVNSLTNDNSHNDNKKTVEAKEDNLYEFLNFEGDDSLDFVDSDNAQENNQEYEAQSKIGGFTAGDFKNLDTLKNFTTHINYSIYTSEHDSITSAENLASTEEKKQLLKEFTFARNTQSKVIQKFARKLRSRLISVQNDQKYYDMYEGTLDNKKITKILTDPLDGRFFKDETPIIAENTAVTLLIDNSGSMRGKPITMAAICADIIAETIERCGAKVEILGFTTKAWRGGQSRKDYESANYPPYPGRLNDLQHIIYKDFYTSYKKSKQSIAVMLKESLLKENIDGEALLWATARLGKSMEKRKILTVISDGAPVDDSTSSANSSDYLENHLKKVIYHFENKTDIEIFAIGIGHDVRNYYKKAVTISNSDALVDALTDKFVSLF